LAILVAERVVALLGVEEAAVGAVGAHHGRGGLAGQRRGARLGRRGLVRVVAHEEADVAADQLRHRVERERLELRAGVDDRVAYLPGVGDDEALPGEEPACRRLQVVLRLRGHARLRGSSRPTSFARALHLSPPSSFLRTEAITPLDVAI